jgi:predicted esterase
VRRWRCTLLAIAACHSQGQAGVGALSSAPAPAPASASASAPAPAPAPASASASAPAPAPVATDWCIDGLSALDEDVCYVLPPMPADRPRRLLVYLHGIVPPRADSPQKHTVETAVLHACQRAGVAALIPRGRRGIGPAQARDWWAWPTTSGAVAQLAPAIVARWRTAKDRLETIAGARFERTYLAGSSNGAYFVAALAVRGEVPSEAFAVDGFGAMSGGGVGAGAAERLARVSPRPFYVGFGTYDDETKTNARALVSTLQAARWPVRSAEHPLGHGANEVYLDEAFAFWDEADLHDR